MPYDDYMLKIIGMRPAADHGPMREKIRIEAVHLNARRTAAIVIVFDM